MKKIELLEEFYEIELRKIVNKAHSESKHCNKYTIPIYKIDKRKNFSLQGTGVLILKHKRYFVATACHVLDVGVKNLFIHPNYRFDILNYMSYDLEEADLLCFEISVDSANEILRNNYIFLSADELAKYEDQEIYGKNCFLAFVGYPGKKNKAINYRQNLSNECFTYLCFLGDKEIISRHGFNPSMHYIFQYNKKDGELKLNMQESQIPPNPYGMSGCGVWLLGEYRLSEQGEDSIEFRKINKLAGIAIECDPKLQYLVATKISILLKILDKI